mgnify:CR=1 FL=1
MAIHSSVGQWQTLKIRTKPRATSEYITPDISPFKTVSIKFSRSKSVGVKHKPPLIGQNTKEVLKDAGYSEEKIQEMLSQMKRCGCG